MSEITKRQFLQIQKVLQRRVASVSLTPGWSAIHEEWNIGSLHGKRLLLTNEDQGRLRRIAQQVTGADPLTAEIEGDRVATVGVVNDEKWSNEAVFGGLIQVTSLKPLETTEGLAITPKGTSLNLKPESIRWQQHRPVIVVENGAAFRYWHDCIIPEDLEYAIAVYRGHDSAIGTVQVLLTQLPTEVEQIGFFDFDPAGLQLAISMGVASIIVPKDPQQLLDSK